MFNTQPNVFLLRERQGSGPPSLETYIPYHTAQEEAYLTTSLSPPDYAGKGLIYVIM